MLMLKLLQMNDLLRPRKRPGLLSTDDVAKDSPASAPKNIEAEPTSEEFITPEAAADRDILEAAQKKHEATIEPEISKKSTPKSKFSLKNLKPKTKKGWAFLVTSVLLISVGSYFAYSLGLHPNQKASPSTLKKVAPPPKTTEVSKLSGLTVPIGTNSKPVTAVQIENSPEARPQSGLKDASVVFEAIAEGGITRFNAIYQDTSPAYVGPIRSLRPYYIDWFWPFDASIAHVGGAPQALADIRSLNIKDLDQFYNGGSYDRVSSRYAPHNVYTSIARLNDLEKAKGFTSAKYDGFKRKKEAKTATPAAKTIDLNVSGYFYNPHYDYDAASNSYLRSQAGVAHKDEKSGAQLAPKVVVAIVIGRGIANDGEHTDYTTVGSGKMYVFQDGNVQEGTWSKTSRQSQWVFSDSNNNDLLLNPGQTWLTMVDSPGSVVYKP